jgi:[acyl-carrier-protein] S-malonyltransferase
MQEAYFVFPGNGVHSSAYFDRELIDTPENQKTLELINKHAGYDLVGMMLDKKDRKNINDEKGRQLATVGASVAIAREIERKGIRCVGRVGLSLGAYAAIDELLDDEELFYLVARRAEAMEKCVPASKEVIDGYKYMAAIANLSRWRIKSICKNVIRRSDRGNVGISNWNTPNQIVISGAVPAVEKAVHSVERKYPEAVVTYLSGAGGPWHNEHYMMPATGEVARVAEKLNFKKPQKTVVYLAGIKDFIKDPEQAGPTLAKEISTETCLWKDILDIFQKKCRTFIDVGPGRVIKGILSKIPNITIIDKDKPSKKRQEKNLEEKIKE